MFKYLTMTKFISQNITQHGTPHPGLAAMATTSSLESLQTDEQRRVLDTVSQVRKCGLESVLSLPRIVVCGDQSSGKSSLLEALTGTSRQPRSYHSFLTDI
jgi:GTP1/Obg family GTP-binding protein